MIFSRWIFSHSHYWVYFQLLRAESFFSTLSIICFRWYSRLPLRWMLWEFAISETCAWRCWTSISPTPLLSCVVNIGIAWLFLIFSGYYYWLARISASFAFSIISDFVAASRVYFDRLFARESIDTEYFSARPYMFQNALHKLYFSPRRSQSRRRTFKMLLIRALLHIFHIASFILIHTLLRWWYFTAAFSKFLAASFTRADADNTMPLRYFRLSLIFYIIWFLVKSSPGPLQRSSCRLLTFDYIYLFRALLLSYFPGDRHAEGRMSRQIPPFW